MKELHLEGLKKVKSGKVREVFEVGNDLLLVATDRVSAFDVVLPDLVPGKGKILTQLSAFWFEQTRRLCPNHVLAVDWDEFPSSLAPFREELEGRSMLAKRCRPLPIECVVRGYLAGSGWKEYQETGSVCGVSLPKGLRESERLPEPIFTPATKAASGHDENIPFQRAAELVGSETAQRVRDSSLEIYRWASRHAGRRGIIVCDTKMEFGWQGSELLLIDELLTPDSSRFWPADRYQPGRPQPSFDKQFIRDYLETLDWDKTSPGPRLPQSVIDATSQLYQRAYQLLSGPPQPSCGDSEDRTTGQPA